MVKVCARTVGVKAAKALGPYVLSVPSVTAVVLAVRGGVGGVNSDDVRSAAVLTVGLVSIVTAVSVAGLGLVSRGHKTAEGGKEGARGELLESIVGVAAGVIGRSACTVESGTYNVSCTGVVRGRILGGLCTCRRYGNYRRGNEHYNQEHRQNASL